MNLILRLYLGWHRKAPVTSKAKALGKKGFLKLDSQTQIQELVENCQITVSNITESEEFLTKIWSSSRKDFHVKKRGGYFSPSFNFCEV